jgi:hypothetical protein
MMDALATGAVLAAAEYSVIYMLLGGGIVGAILIFFAAKALGK